MRHAFKALVVGGLALSLCGLSLGQSLGDVAREQRQKQQAKDNKPAPKVITNEDIPSHDTLADSPRDAHDSSAHHSYEGQPSSGGDKKPAEQWKAEIQGEKNAIASLQKQMDALNASVHYVEANRYWNGVQYNQRQLHKQEEVQRMQSQLEQEKKRLEEMQEGARHDGYGNAVYDPVRRPDHGRSMPPADAPPHQPWGHPRSLPLPPVTLRVHQTAGDAVAGVA